LSKPLIIVESPAKAKTIEKFLGHKYSVKPSLGHVRDLPKSQLGIDIEKGFLPKYINIRGKGEVIKQLREAAKKAPRVLLATDPDREGEAISWHLAYLLGLPENDPNRIEFHEITKGAIQKAVQNPRPINQNLVDAQQARRILDRLVGYKLSPLLWRKVRPGLSAGRVQSVAVRLICDREEEIRNFVQEEYWTLDGLFGRADGVTTVRARYQGRGEEKVEIKSRTEMERLMADLPREGYLVVSVKKKEKKRLPAPPFTTSTLQQEASRKLGFSSRRTMAVAQQLYEGLDLGAAGTTGLVTYIRTDSTRVAQEAAAEAEQYIKEKYGATFAQAEHRREGKKVGVQGAHEAIRPTSVWREPEAIKAHLTRDQYRLYRLIWERFLASQMSPAVYDTVTADIAAAGHLFRATGSTIKFPGFLLLYQEGEDEEARKEKEEILPELVEGEKLHLLQLTPEQHFTQPPPRYTEAMLVKALEEKGIGRPSTYAPIIETIQTRGYVEKVDKRFRPTELGFLVVDLLKQHFPDIVDVEFTAAMEEKLDQIEEGVLSWRQLVNDFYRPFSASLEQAEAEIDKVRLEDEMTDEICEECGRPMVIKHGRYGKFLACSGYPKCTNTRPILVRTGARCPVCGGEIVERRSKKGRKFYGCSNYPSCNFVVWNKPVDKSCPVCGAFLVEKRGRGKGVQYVCSRDGCNYVEEVPSRTARGKGNGEEGPKERKEEGGERGEGGEATAPVEQEIPPLPIEPFPPVES